MWKVGRGKGLAMDGVADDRYLEDIYKYRSITIQFPTVIMDGYMITRAQPVYYLVLSTMSSAGRLSAVFIVLVWCPL